MNIRKSTPWGKPDHHEVLAPGIVSYTTPSHGGIHLDAERQAALPEGAAALNFLHSAEWWEEDLDWVVPYLLFAADIGNYIMQHGTPDDFARHARNLDAARGIVSRRPKLEALVYGLEVEEPDIEEFRRALTEAKQNGEPYFFTTALSGGHYEQVILPGKLGPAWIASATWADFRRIAVS